MEGSNTVIDNRPSVKVFYDCDHLSEADFVSVLLGIEEEVQGGGELKAAYWRFETDSLQRNLEETLLLPHQGETLYCTVKESYVTEATLVRH